MLNNSRPNIVIIDDEKYICDIIAETLLTENYEVVTFNDPKIGLAYLEENPVDLVLTDLVMGEYNGVQIIDSTLKYHPDASVILMTAHPTVETAIQVLKKGAYDFLIKPFKLDLLKATIKRGLVHQQVKKENLHLKEQMSFLQVSQAGAFEEDSAAFMKLVINSVKKEMGAAAVGMMEIDQGANQILNQVYESDNNDYKNEVLDEGTIYNFNYTKSNSPQISKDEIEIDGKIFTKTFISQPIFVRRSLYGIINVVVVNRFDNVNSGQMDVLTLLSNSAATTLVNFRLYEDLEKSYMQAIGALAKSIEARDSYTAGHTERVSQMAELVAVELGWNDKQRRHVRMGCTLHDIGKIGVPDSILNKDGKLTDAEKEMMNNHPELGLNIIKGIDLFEPAIPYIEAHHEWYNGQGYPHQLKEEEIPIEGRLLTVVDTFDAIMSDRPYRKGNSLKNTVAEIIKFSGIQFDPSIVEALLSILKKGQVDLLDFYEREESLEQIEELELIKKSVPV